MLNKQKKRISKILLFSRVISIASIALGILFFFMLFSIHLLPLKYFAFVVGAFSLIFFFLFCFLWKRGKKKFGWLFLINIFLFLMLVIFGIGICYLNNTYHFLDRIRPSNYRQEQYYVVVKETNMSTLASLKKIGVVDSKMEGYVKACQSLKEKTSAELKNYEDESYLQDFESNSLDALFLNSNTYDILKEEHQEYFQHVKILEVIEIQLASEEISKEVNITEEPFHIFISGIDAYGSINRVSRSDVNMIMTIHPKKNQILLTSIPRDYYVQLHGTTGYKDKLTHAGIYGIEKSITTVEDLFQIEINYYIRVNFSTLIRLVDEIGGIDLDSDKAFTAWTNSSCTFQKGVQHVDGACALAYSRERYAYAEGDRHRVQNQQQVLTKILEKLTSSTTLVTKYSSILNALSQSFQTNIPTNQITSFVQYQLSEMPRWHFENQSVDGSGDARYTYSIPSTKLYVMIPNMETVEQATLKIQHMMN